MTSTFDRFQQAQAIRKGMIGCLIDDIDDLPPAQASAIRDLWDRCIDRDDYVIGEKEMSDVRHIWDMAYSEACVTET